jgi:hypothetical protein
MKPGAALGDPIPFALWDKVPPSLAAVLPRVTWSRDRLHRLALPVVQVAVAELRWQLDLPWWRVDRDHFAVTPHEVMRDPRAHAQQWQRTLQADLGFPIHLLAGSPPIILDGVHRLLKAETLGAEHIAAHLVSAALFADHVVERFPPAG